jgi:hypothetical protein
MKRIRSSNQQQIVTSSSADDDEPSSDEYMNDEGEETSPDELVNLTEKPVRLSKSARRRARQRRCRHVVGSSASIAPTAPVCDTIDATHEHDCASRQWWEDFIIDGTSDDTVEEVVPHEVEVFEMPSIVRPVLSRECRRTPERSLHYTPSTSLSVYYQSLDRSLDVARTKLTVVATRVTPNSSSSKGFNTSLLSPTGFSTAWDVTSRNGLATITSQGHQRRKFTIPETNVLKAQTLLDATMLTADLHNNKQWCKKGCRQRCHTMVDVNDILKVRYAKLQIKSRAEQTTYVSHVVGGCAYGDDGRRRLTINNNSCCLAFFLKAYDISKDCYKTVLSQSHGKASIASPGTVNLQKESYINFMAMTFWRDYFQTHCQTADKEVFFWPSGETFSYLYSTLFPPFMRMCFRDEPVPSFSAFKAARRDPEFSNVKDRTTHFHAKCTYCSVIKESIKNASSTEEQQQWLDSKGAHQAEVKMWRNAEGHLTLQARQNPSEINVFWIDDTEATFIPGLSHRPPKALCKAYRVPFVPGLVVDIANQKKTYLYSLKGQHKKGGNRFCTTLHYVYKGAKNASGPGAQARHAVNIGDNYNENRNLTNFCYASECIMAGLWDSVTFIYGLLGHSHWGIDRDHKIHNRGVTKLFCNTLMDFVRCYDHAWHSEEQKPTVAFIDHQFDWDKHYSDYKLPIKDMNERIKGNGSSFLISSFKIEREKSGLVTVKYRTSCNHTDPFLGRDGTPNSEGFVILRERPKGVPEEILPTTLKNSGKITRDLQKEAMHTHMLTQRGGDAEKLVKDTKWLASVVAEGTLPHNMVNGNTVEPGHWGPSANISIHEDLTPVVIDMLQAPEKEISQKDFWNVPNTMPPPIQSQPVNPRLIQTAAINYARADDRAAPNSELQTVAAAVSLELSNDDDDDADEGDDGMNNPMQGLELDNLQSIRRGRVRSRPKKSSPSIARNGPNDYRSDSDSSDIDTPLPKRWNAMKGRRVYVLDKTLIHKGIFFSKSKNRGKTRCYMIKFEGFRLAREYEDDEVFMTRKGANRALQHALQESSDEDRCTDDSAE